MKLVSCVQESVAVLEGEMDDERGKCQRMMDGLRRDIEAQATEVSPLTLSLSHTHYTVHNNYHMQHSHERSCTGVYQNDEEKCEGERNTKQNHGKGFLSCPAVTNELYYPRR